MRRMATVALVLCALLSACGSSSPSTSSRTTPKAELASMRRAARSQHSLHYVSVSSTRGQSLRIVADVGAKEGIERITVTDHGQTGTATVIVSGGTAYMRGDALATRAYFGLTNAQATTYAGKWISVASSKPGYATVSDDVTFPSYISHLFPPQKKLALVRAGRLIGVRGTVHGTARGFNCTAALPHAQCWQTTTERTMVFAPAHGKPLPVKQTAERSNRLGSGVVSMSHWGDAVHVSAPDGAVPLATVMGG